MQRFPIEQLRVFMARVFERCGVAPEDAALAADVLSAADLRGIDSHGVARLNTYVAMLKAGVMNARPAIKVVRETPSTATVDGDNGMGLVVGSFANRIAIEKAERCGSGWVAVNNTNHFGIAGYYVLQSLQRDMIGWAMTNTTACVAPLWGADKMLGTNPIAIAFPGSKEPPIVVDMSTSVVTAGELEMALLKKESVPLGWVIDQHGHPSTNPQDLYDGALLPLGGDTEHSGHKGYCLAAMVDILTSVLSGANWGPFARTFGLARWHRDPPVGKGIGHFFGAMRIDGFIEPDEFKQQIDHWIREFRASRPAPGTSGPIIPGDPERAAEEERKRDGVPLISGVVEKLQQISKDLGVPF